MATCGSLHHIFEKPLPENPTLLESLSSSWNPIKSKRPIEDSSFTEIFGELHFKEKPELSPPSTLPLSSPSSSLFFINPKARVETLDQNYNSNNNEGSTKNPSAADYFSSSHRTQYHKNTDSFSSMNSESLQLCTEGLGFESSADVEELKTGMNVDWQDQEERVISITKHTPNENLTADQFKKAKTTGGAFPPPISSIGESGKPWVCFKSYRQDGRFVLKEIRIPTQEYLHACREDGRLKLQFFQSDDEILEEEEEEEEEEDEDDDDEEDDEHGYHDQS